MIKKSPPHHQKKILHSRNNKSDAENIVLLGENKILRQKLEKYEMKIQELSESKKNLHREYSNFEKREEESQKVVDILVFINLYFRRIKILKVD